jgi:hypothetical protein
MPEVVEFAKPGGVVIGRMIILLLAFSFRMALNPKVD